jgi:hypothetical protein
MLSDHPMLSDIAHIHVETYFDMANEVGGETMLSNAVLTECRTISPHESDLCAPTERVWSFCETSGGWKVSVCWWN